MPSLLQSRYSTYVTWVGKKSGPLTTVLSTLEEVDAFLAPIKVQYLCNMGGQETRTNDRNALQHGGGGRLPCSSQDTYIAWMHKKPGPLTTVLSNMEEVDAFLFLQSRYLFNMGGQEIWTSDNSSLHHGGGGCLPCSSQGTVLM